MSAEQPAPPPAEPPPSEPSFSEPVAPRRRRRAAPWLIAAAAAVVVVILLLAAPFWAPRLTARLPWGTPAKSDGVAALAARLDRIEAAEAKLPARIDRIEAAQSGLVAAGTASQNALGQLDQRLRALETKPPPPPPDLSGIQQQIGALNAALGEVRAQLDKLAKAQAAADPVEAALALLVLQTGEAADAGRPFDAEYRSLAALAGNRPDIAAAAAPLAEPAKTGIAGRAVLARELHALAGAIATAAPPPAADDWSGQIMARLRSVVTIRRLDGAEASPAEAAVDAAEKALAQGDLAEAVAAIRKLGGAAAAAARPWLTMAETRLRVEETLRNLTTILAARLGKPAPAPSSSG